MSAAPQTQQLDLELGDIIQMIAPTNDEINDRIFLIDYIDQEQIVAIDDQSLEKRSFRVENGDIADRSIQEIAILDKPEEKGYLAQNGLAKDQWIEIHIAGDVPTIITGQITDTEEDMMEVTIFPTNDKIYIDFAYKGIPRTIPITQIKKREGAPEEVQKREAQAELSAVPEVDSEGMPLEGEEDGEGVVLRIPREDVRDQIKQVLAEADDFSFGDDVESITQQVVVSDDEKRFSIDVQANDLLDEMLSTIPNIERTTRVLQSIHTMINRFKELRKEYSVFETNGSISSMKKHGPGYKPLVDRLTHLDQSVSWLIPVVNNRYKLYDVNVNPTDQQEDMDVRVLVDDLENAEAILARYRRDEGDSASRYAQLVQSLNPYYTPFGQQTDEAGTIGEIPVERNIPVLIDNVSANLQEFYTHVARGSNIAKQRFVSTMYNLGITGRKQIDKTNKNETVPVDITRADTAAVKGFVSLPQPYVAYAHVSLPATSIYKKANLNQVHARYWKVLREHTSVTSKVVDQTFDPVNEEDQSFLRDVLHFSLEDGVNDDDKYRMFLSAFLPHTNAIFEHMKKYMENETTLHGLLQHFEPFAIYHKDISFKQYDKMVDFIDSNIKNMYKRMSEQSKETNQIRNVEVKITFIASALLSILGLQKSGIEETYELNTPFSGEILKKLMTTDYGRYYNNEISLLDSHLLTNIDIEKSLETSIEELTARIETTEADGDDKCNTIVLAKKYSSMAELNEDDNTVDVFFDPKYDETQYDIVDNYASQREAMDPEEFLAFVTQQLMTNIGLSQEKASYDAETMIAGRKRVKEGQYAMLETLDDDNHHIHYYRRDGNIWAYDADMTGKTQTEQQRLFCNTRAKCMQLKEDCDSIEIAGDKIMKDNLEKVVSDIQSQGIKDSELLIKSLKDRQQGLKATLERLIAMKFNQMLANDVAFQRIAQELDDIENIVSPYQSLFFSILAEQDLSVRYKYLNQYINRYTRAALPDSEESEYWLYCDLTNTKLVPTFYSDLATAYFNTAYAYGDNLYLQALDRICAERGEISDDGDRWVDKHSGFVIRAIESDVDEGFDEQGYRLQTRELLDGDYIVGPSDRAKSSEKQSPEAVMTRNIVNALSFYVGIDMKDNLDFIVTGVMTYLSKQMPSEPKYEAYVERMKKKGKKVLPYETKKHQLILFFAGLYFLIAIQTSVPGVKTRKTFPGCAKSFEGFPMDATSFGGVQYISCVMKKISSSQKPWNALKGLSEDSLKKNMIKLYDALLSNDGQVQKKMNEKEIYQQERKDGDIPEQVSVTRWATFLPPLVTIKQERMMQVSDEFRKQLMERLKSGDPNQINDISIIRGKIIGFSLNIVAKIQDIVEKEPALLETMGGEPFLQNVCCDGRTQDKTINFFTEKNSDIVTSNKRVEELTTIYRDVTQLAKSPYLYSSADTKRKYPSLLEEFDERTIYQAFLQYCNFYRDIPLADDLRPICIDNTSDVASLQTLQEKIALLKREGKTYTRESLKQLLSIIAKRNFVHIEMTDVIYDKKAALLQLIERVEEMEDAEDRETRETEIIPFLRAVVTQYDANAKKHSDALRALRNYVLSEIDNKKSQLFTFVKRNGNMSRVQDGKIKQVIDTLCTFHERKDRSGFRTNEEMTTIESVPFIHQCIKDAAIIYPTMIRNEVSYEAVNVPTHWKLSKVHKMDIIKMMKKNYQELATLYGDATVKEVMPVIQREASLILKLADSIRYTFSLHEKNERENLLEYEVYRELFEYILYDALVRYIEVADNVEIEVDVKEVQLEDGEAIEEIDLLSGDVRRANESIAQVLIAYLTVFERQKGRINMNKTMINEMVLRSKEKEKDIKTEELKQLSIEQRKADMELRKAKMGRWGVGLQKGLTQYVKDTYDQERAEMEKNALIDKELGRLGVVTDMNRELYAMDFLDQAQLDDIAEQEAYDMSGMADDDDYGDRDGDEQFY